MSVQPIHTRPTSAQPIGPNNNNLRIQSLDPGNLSVEADKFKHIDKRSNKAGGSSTVGLSRSKLRRHGSQAKRRRGRQSTSSGSSSTSNSSSRSTSSSARSSNSGTASTTSSSGSSDSSNSSDYADSTHGGKYWHRHVAPVVPNNGGRALRDEDYLNFIGPLHQPLPPKSAIPILNGGSASGSSLLMARLQLHKGYPYSEPATVFEWSATYKSWCPRQTRLIVSTKPFSEGAMRASYYVIDLEAPHVLFVGKRYRKKNVRSGQYFNDASMHWVSNHWADNFNRFLPPKRVEFVPAAVAQLPLRAEEKGRTFVLGLEPYLSGTFRKYNNNSGFVSSAAQRSTPQAFSHFTFHYSCGELMIVDIQGVDDAYTDPQILTRDGEGYGRGNLGADGMRRFFKSHRCNAVCEYMRLPNMRAMRAEQQRGKSASKTGVAESFSTSSDDDDSTYDTTSSSDYSSTNSESTASSSSSSRSRTRSRRSRSRRRSVCRDSRSKGRSKSKSKSKSNAAERQKPPIAPATPQTSGGVASPLTQAASPQPLKVTVIAAEQAPSPTHSMRHRRSVSFQGSPLGDPIPAAISPTRRQSTKAAPTEEEMLHTSVVLSRFQEIMLGRLSSTRRNRGEAADGPEVPGGSLSEGAASVLASAIQAAASIPTQPASAASPMSQRLSPGAMATPSPNSAPVLSASPVLDRPSGRVGKVSDPTAHLPETMMRHNSILATSSNNLKLVLQQIAAMGEQKDAEKVIISNRLIAPNILPTPLPTSPGDAQGPASPNQGNGSILNSSAALLNLPPGFEQLASPLALASFGVASPIVDKVPSTQPSVFPSESASSRPEDNVKPPRKDKADKKEKREKKDKHQHHHHHRE